MVEFSCKTKKKEQITFSCRQDNWVTAKNGGMWKIDFDRLTTMQKLGMVFPSQKCFITRKMLYAAACENEELYMTDKALIENVMLKLGYNKDEYKITKNDVGWFVVSLVFETGEVIKFFLIPESVVVDEVASKGVAVLIQKVLSHKITTMAGVSLSSISIVNSSVDILDKLVKKKEYNAITNILDTDTNSLVCTSMHLPGARRSWGSWKQSCLINKYQDGYRGEVDVNISTNDIISFCEWKNPNNRK